MTYEEIVEVAKEAAIHLDLKSVKGSAIVEFDISGDGEGAFYIKLEPGRIEVSPYEYYDYDCRVRTDAETAVSILRGEIDAIRAVMDGRAGIEGNSDNLAILASAIRKAEPEQEG